LVTLGRQDPGPRLGRVTERSQSPDALGWAHLRRHWQAYATVYLQASLSATVLLGTSAWVPAFFQRTYHWTAAQIGIPFGLIYSIAPIVGVFAAGWIGDYFDKRGVASGKLLVSGAAAVIMIPFAAFLLMPSPTAALLLLLPYYLLVGTATGIAPLSVQEITPRAFRGQATALYVLTVNLIAAGLGPLLPGFVTQHVLQDPDQLRYGVLCVPVIMLPLTACVVWFGRAAFNSAQQAAAQINMREAATQECP
jgi:MFS family permease